MTENGSTKHKETNSDHEVTLFNQLNDFGEDFLELSKKNFEKNFILLMKKNLSSVRSKCADYNYYAKQNYNKLLV